MNRKKDYSQAMEMSSPKQDVCNEKEMIKDEKRFRKRMIKYFGEYCGNTSIHGFRYLSERRTICERVWWIISITTSLLICIVLVMHTYEKWQTTPVIVTFATKESPSWQIPFPAVTICPEAKSIPSKFNFTHHMMMKLDNETLEPDAEKKFGYLSLMCNYDPSVNYSLGPHIADNDFFDFLDDVNPDFYETFAGCQYLTDFYQCEELFFPIITDEGLCYTFNLLDRTQMFRDNVVFYKNFNKAPELSNWTLENGYSVNDDIETYPKRALFSGSIFALQGILTVYEDEMDAYCRDGLQGFKMQISHPSRMPRTQQQHIRIPLDRTVSIAVSPNIIRTSDAVKKYDPHIRNCYFPSERPLKYFKVYSQENCQIECRTNFTTAACGCIDFYMPRDNNTPVCSQGKLDCLFQSEEYMLYSLIERKLEVLRKGTWEQEDDILDGCDCLPICTSMKYSVEVSTSQWAWENIIEMNTTRKQHKSLFQVYFKASQFMSSERNELFGITDFLANFGGLLGLFIGFSLLSLIEIVYYLTLRLVKNIRLFNNWSGV